MHPFAVQLPSAEREDALAAGVRGQQGVEFRFARLRDEISATQAISGRRELLRELVSAQEAFGLYTAELEKLGDPRVRGTHPGDDMNVKVASSREKFGEVKRLVAEFSASIEGVLGNLQTQHRALLQAHYCSEIASVSTFGVLIIGGAVFIILLAKRVFADSFVKEDLREQLKAAELKYRSIFDNAVEGFFQTTPDGRFISVNQALARMYGYKSPQHLIECVPDIGTQLVEEPSRRAALLETLQRRNVVSNFEVEVVRADGRSMWIRENVRAVRDPKGRLLYLEGVVEDVSDRWWSEQRRRLQNATARVLDRAPSVAGARPMILQTICEILDWDMGAVWDVNSEEGVLECVEVWHAPHIDITEFEMAVSDTTHPLGEGLAGEVWKSGEPKWIANLATGSHTVGAKIAVKHGMGSAFGIPLKIAGEVRHVAEFFSPKIALPDPELLQTLGMVASQLGYLIERKSADEALRKSEMRKAAILQSALDCIISFDLDGRIIEFNPAAERAFGIPQADAVGRDVVDLIAPGQLTETHRRGIALYHATNVLPITGRRVELIAIHSSGHEFPIEVAVSRINIDGTPMFTAFLRDISERKQAEELNLELAAVVANSNDAIVGCTIEGIIRSWNEGAERIYGWMAEEVIGRPLELLIPAERLDECPRTLATVRQGDSVANYETLRLRKDGKKISVSVTESPIRSDDGWIIGLSSIARDITERKRLEEELLQSQKMDAVGRLAGGIAHDFNNILTAILGYSDLLIGQIEPRHWMYRHLSEIRKAADFAAALTHQLLAFSRRQPLYLRVFAINDTVRNMQKMLQRVIGEQVKIRTEFTAEGGRLRSDPSQIEQVLLNLCVNARDAMPHGGIITIATADVSFSPDDESLPSDMSGGDYVKLTVSDTGTGIAPDVIKHIFEPFFTTKESGQGTGLGLPTCYGIVKQSGGYIAVDSVVGEGTTFSVYLPRVDESGEKTSSKNEMGQLPGGNETVLYVEDELTVRSLTAHVLRKLGYVVLEAADAAQAKEITESHGGNDIDLLFSDVVLPDAGGRQLADWLMTRNARARVLFTSGYVDEAILRQQGIDAVSAFLQKPFSPSDLARKVREVIDAEAEASNLLPAPGQNLTGKRPSERGEC
ncbi:PAS domain S-box protein [Verrucomicrobiota bacterium sgz303538]